MQAWSRGGSRAEGEVVTLRRMCGEMETELFGEAERRKKLNNELQIMMNNLQSIRRQDEAVATSDK